MKKSNPKKISKDIYNITKVLNTYCNNNLQNECIDEIAPILHILMKLADELYFDLSENF
jgi:hypothetical protein